MEQVGKGKEINRDDVIGLLRRENPKAQEHDLVIYADYFMSYRTAAANIAEHGDIALHPRTGQPFENPYGAIRDKAAAALRKIQLEVGCLWGKPRVWWVCVMQGGDDPPLASEYSRVLADTEENAADTAALDFELPAVVWVKNAVDGAPRAHELVE